jgi:hypothetical protein
MTGLMAIIQITRTTWGIRMSNQSSKRGQKLVMSRKTTPLTRDAVTRIVKAEVRTHGHIRKDSHAAKVQSILDKRAAG